MTFDEKGFIDCLSAVINDAANDPGVLSISWGWDENQPFNNTVLWSPAAIDHVNHSLLAAAQLGIVGGTSASAPLWGSLITRINALLGSRVGNFNALLYQKIGPAKVLRDITSGNNDTDGLLNGQFPAGPGWDACTGWGVPDGANLLYALKSK